MANLVEVTGQAQDVTLDDSVEQADVTAAGDDGMDYVDGQADHSLAVSLVWTPTIDRLIDRLIDEEENIHYRYLPAGEDTGRREFTGQGVINEYSGDVSTTAAVMASLGIAGTDLDYDATTQ